MTVSSRVSFTVTQVSSDFLDFFPTFEFSSGLCQSGDRESSIIIIISFILIQKYHFVSWYVMLDFLPNIADILNISQYKNNIWQLKMTFPILVLTIFFP